MKQKSLRENHPLLIAQKVKIPCMLTIRSQRLCLQSPQSILYEKMLIFNREQEEIRKAREKKEREWQEELDRSMSMSDPTGHGELIIIMKGKARLNAD